MGDSDLLFLKNLLSSSFSIEIKVRKMSLVFYFRCNAALLYCRASVSMCLKMHKLQ